MEPRGYGASRTGTGDRFGRDLTVSSFFEGRESQADARVGVKGSVNEYRHNPRRRTLKAAVASFNQGHATVRCRVVDISQTGCRLATEGTVSIPDTFQLDIELDGLRADCEVVWRNNEQLGARFVSSPTVRSPRREQVVSPYRPEPRPSLRRKDARILPAGGSGQSNNFSR